MNRNLLFSIKCIIAVLFFAALHAFLPIEISMSAVVTGGVFGQYRNRIGNVVYAYRNGQQVAKSYNPKPRYTATNEQIQNRGKLGALAKIGRQMASAIDILVSNPGEGGTKRSSFVSLNYPFMGWNPSTGVPVPSWSDITFGSGPLTPPQNTAVNSGTNVLSITFDNTPVGDQEASDQVIVAVAFANLGLFVELEDGVDITTGTADIPYLDDQIGEVVHVYAILKRPFSDKKSTTIYVGQETLA